MKTMRFFALVLALVCILCAVVACDDGTTNTEDTTAAETTKTPPVTVARDEETTAAPAPEKITYTITVKDQNGDPVEGVELQICVDGICKKPTATDENGVATFKIDDPGDSKLELQFNADNSTAGYNYPAEKRALSADQTEVNVTVTKN